MLLNGPLTSFIDLQISHTQPVSDHSQDMPLAPYSHSTHCIVLPQPWMDIPCIWTGFITFGCPFPLSICGTSSCDPQHHHSHPSHSPTPILITPSCYFASV